MNGSFANQIISTCLFRIRFLSICLKHLASLDMFGANSAFFLFVQVVLAWDPIHGESSRPYSCLARVTFPGMQLLNSLAVDLVASVIYDHVA